MGALKTKIEVWPNDKDHEKDSKEIKELQLQISNSYTISKSGMTSNGCPLKNMVLIFSNNKLDRIDVYFDNIKDATCLLKTVREIFGREDKTSVNKERFYWHGTKATFLFMTENYSNGKFSVYVNPDKNKKAKFSDF